MQRFISYSEFRLRMSFLSSSINCSSSESSTARMILEDSILLWITVIQLILSLITVIGCLILVWSTVYVLQFHNNCKILLLTLLFQCSIEAVDCAFIQGEYVFRVLSVQSLCSLFIPKYICNFLRLPSTWTSISFVLTNGFLVLERVYAYYRKEEYEKGGYWFGIVTMLMSTFLPISLIFPSTFLTFETDNIIYCLTAGSEKPSTIAKYITIACFLVVDMMAFGVLSYLHRISKMERERRIHDLSTNYQLMENVTVVSVLLPLVTVHAVFYIFFMVIHVAAGFVSPNMEYRAQVTLFAATYGVPYYCFFVVVFFLCSLLKIKSRHSSRSKSIVPLQNVKEKEADVYFESYEW